MFTFSTKLATLMRRSTVLSLPPQLVFPVREIRTFCQLVVVKYFRKDHYLTLRGFVNFTQIDFSECGALQANIQLVLYNWVST